MANEERPSSHSPLPRPRRVRIALDLASRPLKNTAMATASLHIDLDAILANWRAMDALTGPGTETGAVVKADSYGLGAARVAALLARAGCRKFFVAAAEEGVAVRKAIGPGPEIV